MFDKSTIEKYFTEEKSEAVLFLIIGILAICVSLFCFLYLKKDFFKGLALPFAFFGLVHSMVGYTIYNRSDKDRITNVYAYDMNPYHFKEVELPRMKKVNKNFVIYRYSEVFLLFIGCILFFYFLKNDNYLFWKGLGLALLLEAAISLCADYFAEKRGNNYQKGIESFLEKKGLN